MKSSGWAYFLAALGLVTPIAGVHRFYLGRPASAILYLFTWGFFGIGTIFDLISMQRMVDDENRRLLYPGSPVAGHHYLGPAPVIPAQLALPPAETPKAKLPLEQQILRVAKEHEGAVTVDMVAVETGISMREAKKELEKLRKEEFCTVDVSTEGAKLYVFEGLRSNRRLDFDS